jgi:hypothetical protein
MLNLKLVNVVLAEPALGKLLASSREGKLEFKTSYWLKKLIVKLEPELKDFNEVKKDLFEKFGEDILNEEGQATGDKRIPEENMEDFTKYFNELLAFDIQIDNVRKFTLEELDKAEGITLDDVSALEPFIEETVEESTTERKKIKLSID